jgi:DNA-binding NarL/FixJ family response regulator
MRVMILEDEVIISRDVAEAIVSEVEDIHIANCYDAAIRLMRQFSFDICLSDINLNEEKTGIDFVREITKLYPNIQIVYITAHYDENTIKATEDTNPLGFIVKPFTLPQIIAIIQQAINKVKLLNNSNQGLEKLTSQEQKILGLISTNISNREISEKLFVSEKTIRNHRYNMLKKLNIPKEKNALFLFGLKCFPKKS